MVHKEYVTLSAMRCLNIILSGLLCLHLLALEPGAAFAQREQDEALKGRKQGDLKSYGQIAREAESKFGGRVVGQKLLQTGPDSWVYELKLLMDDGKVLMVTMDAKTGRVLKKSGR